PRRTAHRRKARPVVETALPPPRPRGQKLQRRSLPRPPVPRRARRMETDPPIPADEPRASAPRDEWETSSGARRRFRFGWVIVSALIVVAGTLLLLRDHTPELTRELLDRAHTVWLEQGIEDYRLRFIKRVDR